MPGTKHSTEYKLIAKSKYFNRRWYLKHYPDVASSGIDPVKHYLRYGWREGRNPGPNFNTREYLRKYPDCKIVPLIDLISRDDEKAQQKTEYKIISHSKYFDKKWYLNVYSDVKRAGVDPVQHYMTCGWSEGRNPSPKFNTNGYLKRYPECKINPVVHFETVGRRKHYQTGQFIDERVNKDYWAKHNKKKQIRQVIYSCISGGYDEIITDFCPNPDYDYVLFTDNTGLLKKKTFLWWQIRPLAFSEMDSVRNARWHKLHPHILFPEYDYSVWLDSNVQISGNKIYNLLKKHIQARHKVASSIHPYRDCIYDEADMCIVSGKDNSALINKQMVLLHSKKYPAHNGLYETNVLLRRHNDKGVIDLCNQWWDFIKNYSRRDQLSFNYLLWKNGIKHYPIDKKSLRFHPEFKLIFHNYKPAVTKYTNNKILVHLHLFYTEQLDWFLRRLKNITCNYDLCVTVVKPDATIEKKIMDFKPDAKILVVPNRGYDVYPFWLALQDFSLSDYDFVLKLHTKNSRDTLYIKNGIKYIGYDWRNDLVDSLIGSKHIFNTNIKKFTNDDCGMVCCKNLIVQFENPIRRNITKQWAQNLGILYLYDAPFCAGTMFCVRPEFLQNFQKYKFKPSDFSSTSTTGDTTSLAHSLETMFGIMVANKNKKIYGADTMKTKIKRLKVHLSKLKQKCIISHRDIWYIRHSKYFDRKWYLHTYPDVAAAKCDPAKHYLMSGWRENRNPGPLFYTSRYLQRNTDVMRAGINPLLHYEKYGRFENRAIAPSRVDARSNGTNMLNYKTYNDMAYDIKSNLSKVPTDIDLVVGVPRSGMLPAYIIGLALNKKVCSLSEFTHGILVNAGVRKTNSKGTIKKILVVDDSVNTGLAMQKVRKELAVFTKKYKFTFLAVYTSGEEATKYVDIALNVLPQPRMFQWNYLYHGFMSDACYDMDGVLCVDPTEEENDDGEKYIKFIKNATPLYLPNRPIGYIVTSRLEKYRKETEGWLDKHGIKYKKLYMFNGTAEERRRLGLHADFKADVYGKIKNSSIFIESNPAQAKRIAELSHKNVICCLNDKLYR